MQEPLTTDAGPANNRALSDWLEAVRVAMISSLGAMILRVLDLTLRWEIRSSSGPAATYMRDCKDPIILTFWHNRQLLMPFFYRRTAGAKMGVAALISRHRDGRLVAESVRRLGIDSVAGSSTRGAVGALKSLVREVRRGRHVGVTPDGPKGPIYECKPGVIGLASLSGAPIIPMHFSVSRKWVFRSWDRMELPKPFSKVIFEVGDPIYVPRELDDSEVEAYRQRVELALVELATRLEIESRG